MASYDAMQRSIYIVELQNYVRRLNMDDMSEGGGRVARER